MSKRTWIIALAIVAALALPKAGWAHDGHEHKKVMGTVTAIDGQHLDVKTTDGKTVSVMLNDKTTYMHGKMKMADGKMLKAGDRVVIEVEGEGKMMTAKSVQMGVAEPKPAKKS